MNTNNNFQEKNRIYDIIKWMLVILFLITAVISNYLFKHYNPILRTTMVIVMLLAASIIGLLTTKGKNILLFTKEARIELKKVIWPTHNETLQMTFIITLVTIVIALVLWGLDAILVHAVSFIINLRF